jgi:hypothetical protein
VNPIDKIIDRIRVALRPEPPDVCLRCGRHVNPLLHVLYPLRCPGRPPIGGWPEPRRDDL